MPADWELFTKERNRRCLDETLSTVMRDKENIMFGRVAVGPGGTQTLTMKKGAGGLKEQPINNNDLLLEHIWGSADKGCGSQTKATMANCNEIHEIEKHYDELVGKVGDLANDIFKLLTRCQMLELKLAA